MGAWFPSTPRRRYSILSPFDFVLALPDVEGLDSVLTLTDKFSKRIMLIPGAKTYKASQWAERMLAELTRQGWGIPVAIISDRDSKFLSSLWRHMFKQLGTELLTSTAYHPQTDGQLERTNQTVEVALRYHSVTRGADWTKVLPYIQGTLNNSESSSTGRSPNEIIYGIKVREALDTLDNMSPEDLDNLRQIHRQEAEDSIACS